MEAAFQRTHYPDVNIVDRLSEVLNITTDKISIWFQNRRAKHKRTKKPVGGDQITLFREIENPMELIEAAQREIQLKNLAAEQDNLNSSVDTTRDNKSPVSDHSVHNESTAKQQQQQQQQSNSQNNQFGNNSNVNSGNFILIRNVSAQVDQTTLRALCSQHASGQLTYYRYIPQMTCVIVRYNTKEEANNAQNKLNSVSLGNTQIFTQPLNENDLK